MGSGRTFLGTQAIEQLQGRFALGAAVIVYEVEGLGDGSAVTRQEFFEQAFNRHPTSLL
jgi:hypothetical protein